MTDVSRFNLSPEQAEKVKSIDARMKFAEKQFAICIKPGRTKRQRELAFNRYVETIAQLTWERISVKKTPSMSFGDLKSALTAKAREQLATAKQQMAEKSTIQ